MQCLVAGILCNSIFAFAAIGCHAPGNKMASTKHTPQSTQTASPWRHHLMVRLIPILALVVISAVYLNGKSINDDAQGRTGMDKLLNEPILKDEPLLFNEPELKGTEQKEQVGENEPVLKETLQDSILLPTESVATPSTKSAKAKGGDPKSKSKSKSGKSKSKSKSKGSKSEGAKANKHGGKSKGAKSGSKSKESKAAKAKGASAKAKKHDGKATKSSSSKAGKSKEKSKEKSKGGAKSVKKKRSAKATAEKIALDLEEETIDEEVEAEYIIEDAE